MINKNIVIQIQKIIESINASRLSSDDIFRAQRIFSELPSTIKAADLAQQIQAFTARSSMPKLDDLLASQASIQAATRSLPNISNILGSTHLDVLAAFSSINTSILEANFIAELDLSEDEGGNEERYNVEEQIERQLSESTQYDGIEKLQLVEFAPVTFLEDVANQPETMRALSSRDFEKFIASLVDRLGFENVQLTPGSGDEGRDVLATKTVRGIPILFAFECKKYAADRHIGPDIARALLGVVTHGSTRVTKGVLVTTSYFTPAAHKFILTEPRLSGRDFDGIVEWLRECGTP